MLNKFLVGREKVSSKCESDLRLQPAVIRSFKEPLAIGPTSDPVCRAKQRRGDISGDWSGIRVIQQILNRHREDHVVAADRLRRPDDSP